MNSVLVEGLSTSKFLKMKEKYDLRTLKYLGSLLEKYSLFIICLFLQADVIVQWSFKSSMFQLDQIYTYASTPFPWLTYQNCRNHVQTDESNQINSVEICEIYFLNSLPDMILPQFQPDQGTNQRFSGQS